MRVYFYLILLSVYISAEVITLIKDQKVKCVITGESVYSAIEVTPWVEFKRPVEIVENWTTPLKNGWNDCDGNKCAETFDAVTDQRWEGFNTVCSHRGAMKLKEYRQFFSLYFESNSTTEIKVLKNGATDLKSTHITFAPPEKQWTHNYSKKNGNSSEINGHPISQNLSIDSEWVEFYNKRKTCRKLHKYNFMYSNFTGESNITISDNSLNCIFMYISVDKNCSLEVRFEKGNNRVNEPVEGFNQNKTFREWRPFNITNNSGGSGSLYLSKRNSTNKSECFWAVAEIQKCRNKIEIHTVNLGNGREQHKQYICRTLKRNNNIYNIESMFSVTKHLDVPNKLFNCSEVLGNSYPNCEKHKICLENGTCFCSWGYKGSLCNEACPDMFWGLNCIHSCNINCDTCVHLDGYCTKCKKGFTGDQCQSKVSTWPINKYTPPISTSQNINDGKDEAKPHVGSNEHENYNYTLTKNYKNQHSTEKTDDNTTKNNTTTPKSPMNELGVMLLIVVTLITAIVTLWLYKRRRSRNLSVAKDNNVGEPNSIQLGDVASLEQHSQFLEHHSLGEQENRNKSYKNRQRQDTVECTNNILKHLFRRDMSILSVRITANFQEEVENFLSDIELLDQLINYLNQITMSNFICVLSEDEKTKNRFRTILPGQSQVFLPASLATSSSTYINAISVDCYNYPKKFIVTQQPLPNTVEDFWILIRGYEIDTIVSLNHEHDAHCPEFWPSHHTRSMLISDFCHITYLKTVNKSLYTITKVLVNKREINIIRVKRWDRESTTPESVIILLEIWERLRGKNGQIVVTCYDGATASGLFVALAFLLEKINKENVCDVFSAVKTVRQSRFLFVQYSEQLTFLFEAALTYVQSFILTNNL